MFVLFQAVIGPMCLCYSRLLLGLCVCVIPGCYWAYVFVLFQAVIGPMCSVGAALIISTDYSCGRSLPGNLLHLDVTRVNQIIMKYHLGKSNSD